MPDKLYIITFRPTRYGGGNNRKEPMKYQTVKFAANIYTLTAEAADELIHPSAGEPDAALVQMIRQGLSLVEWVPGCFEAFSNPLEPGQSPETQTSYNEWIDGHWAVDGEMLCSRGAVEAIEGIYGEAEIVDDAPDPVALVVPMQCEIRHAARLGMSLVIEPQRGQLTLTEQGGTKAVQMDEHGTWINSENVHRTMAEAVECYQDGALNCLHTTWQAA